MKRTFVVAIACAVCVVGQSCGDVAIDAVTGRPEGVDGGLADTGPPDVAASTDGALDTSSSDGGQFDGGPPDAAPADSGVVAATLCGPGKPQDIVDDFEDGVVSPFWHDTNQPGVTSETGGAMHLTPALSGGWIRYISPQAYALRNCAFSLEIRQALAVDSSVGQTYLALGNNHDKFVQVSMGLDEVIARHVDGNDGGYARAPYDPSKHRWWRIREAAGTVTVEYSPNGLSYAPMYSFPTPAFVDQLDVDFGAGTWNGNFAGSTAIIDNLNVPPG